MTKLAVSIQVESHDQALADAAAALRQGADLVEFRIDRFTNRPDQLLALVEASALPCIITCRPVWEGGAFDGDESVRHKLVEVVGHCNRPPAYLDVELAAFQQDSNMREIATGAVDQPAQVHPTTTGLILSTHDFENRPIDLYQRLEAMIAAPACRVIKVAWRARSLRENLEVFEIIQQRHKPTIALCMGEYGLPSRVLARKFGALLTFVSLAEGAGTAPGQPTIEQVKKLYRWDEIHEQTEVFGVIGHPVAHSMSPAVHNAGFTEVGHDGVYLPLPIAPSYEQFAATMESWTSMDCLHFRGASVTIPHKENLLRYVQEQGGDVDPLALKIGAANTLAVHRDGGQVRLQATNTDYAGALEAVCDGMGIRPDELQGQRVAVLGAGGAARAVVAGFAHHGATVVIYNRTYERAVALAEALSDLGGRVVPARLEKLCDSCCQIFVNCTSVGMHPATEVSPMPQGNASRAWRPGTVVFDTIYNPIHTRLLRDARAAGCLTISGVEMFVRQAAAQFRLWTGRDAPLETFRRIVLNSLSQ